jgi:anti-sigma B factor antagonist
VEQQGDRGSRHVAQAAGLAVVVPPVEIDLASADRLADGIAAAFAAGAGPVHVDFSGVTFCDSTGLRVLVAAAERAREAGRHFGVLHPTRQSTIMAAVLGAAELLLSSTTTQP